MELTLGQITPVGFNFAARNTVYCAGGLLTISDNTALFSLLNTFYGGDGRTTFAVPDLRGRSAVAQGRHTGSAYNWQMGNVYGFEQISLDVNHMATHSHNAHFTPSGVGVTADVTINAKSGKGDSSDAQNNYWATGETGGRTPEAIVNNYSTTTDTTMAANAVDVNVQGSFDGSVQIEAAGAGSPFPILQPILVVNYLIATQ